MRSGRRELSLANQLLFLRKSRICPGSGALKRGRLLWRFEARPSPLSRTYRVRLEYKQGESPDVFVEDPDLELLAEGRALPHVYRNPLRLCLYLPDAGQWDASMRIDTTIIPWTYTWLYYFEDWLAFDEWKGGGKHPNDLPEDRRMRRMMRRRA